MTANRGARRAGRFRRPILRNGERARELLLLVVAVDDRLRDEFRQPKFLAKLPQDWLHGAAAAAAERVIEDFDAFRKS